ncbi:NAD(P)/FAD-dependent oxidoreductase [Haloferax mediterranei ATCC 33500]|uniref:NAD(P)/FAD-dependent oxidoreductase n=1 Tax=Haloferax mediterranei (strain ATCC 33500 / DSM 1411 / JCM 8866 / NBRC 14739 / NCIMB 2177 / R-4) TaxID=523841 RepID=I3R3D5_HALMT|nr:NAD(P)/FAD-dependent oxidoreductase [Haloferax mediterranei]AFK18745.1 thioredoxin reductase (NADPH) [Haloferax mediterranei ATCC 33500]AHZ21887.1 thioredoxin-disulfide reductase [Haloferax mediterranei ATCC 33500]EMA03395.1 thioredoxin reductase [Haloferax mediterranei ATCC 33500]MDX5988841.1 NAD(P)/FAD-dependent oxidoreductase [Haloferax mediterranei ATCC 33500]QCQ75242.1 NAD(P)/FAD-dependent oxidoreductase [Haloferax mediterranei ATCC 33500]
MTKTDERQEYEVVVVGGGPAGLQSALYTTRLGHDTALVDRGGGRAAMMLDTHNVIGVTEEQSGNEFLGTARQQLEDYGTEIHRDFVTDAEQLDDGRFRLVGNDGEFVAERVVLGVGFNDKRPDPPLPRTGKGLHYCLHCDAYMFVDESVYVMGHSDSAAYVAMIMLNFTDEVDILLRGEDPSWSDETDELVRAHPVDIIDEEISGMTKRDDGWLESFEFEDGSVREYKGGFAMYGSEYNTTLFDQLGVERNDDGTVPVDDHGRTSVDGVFAVGDITPGHNQIPVAMGKGAKAGIAIHMELREFPKSLDEIRAEGDVSINEVPGISSGLLAKAKQFNQSHADD